MKTHAIIFAILLLPFFYSCNKKSRNIPVAKNDTSIILKTLFDSTVNLPRLLDIDRLYNNNPFGDSVIVTTSIEIFQRLSALGKFKLLTFDSICKMYVHWDKTKDFPNYLGIDLRKPNDSLFEISISNFRIDNSRFCIPSLNKACYKSMTFTKSVNTLIPKLKKTLYD